MKNILLIEQKNIKDNYLKLQNKYKNLFEQYILSLIDLGKYDNLILNSNLDFGLSKPTNKQLFTNLKEYLNLKYIYIINNFFVEKLNNEELTLLKETSDILNDENKSLIINTYKDIIKDDFNGTYSSAKNKVCYGYNIPSNYAFNDELVIHIIYSRNTKLYDDKAFVQNIKEKRLYIQKISNDIKTEIAAKLNLSCHIIVTKNPN